LGGIKLKKAISWVLVVVLLLSSLQFAAFAGGENETTPCYTVESKTVDVSGGAKTVEVSVSLTGVASSEMANFEEAVFSIQYDTSAMNLTGAVAGSALSGIAGLAPDDSFNYNTTRYTLPTVDILALDDENFYEMEIAPDGEIAKLTFQVNADAANGDYNVQVVQAHVKDSDNAQPWFTKDFDDCNVTPQTVAGVITVTGGSAAGPCYTVESKTVDVSGGAKTVEVSVSLTGVASSEMANFEETFFSIQYDTSAMNLTGAVAGSALSGIAGLALDDSFYYDTTRFTLPTVGISAYDENCYYMKIAPNGEVAKLTFQVNADAANGDYNVQVVQAQGQSSAVAWFTKDNADCNVTPQTVAGTITVTGGTGDAGNNSTYVLQVQKSDKNTLHGQVTLSWGTGDDKKSLFSDSTNVDGLRATIPAGTEVTVTATPVQGYQLTRLAYSYSYTATTGNKGGVSPSLAQNENLDSTKAITTTFKMPEANVYVTAAFGAVSTVTGAGSDKLGEDGTYTVSKDETPQGTYTISRVSTYSSPGTSSAEFPTDGSGIWPDDVDSADVGVGAVELTETVKVTVSPGAGFFVRA
jgi:hypothetical protein